MKLSIVICTYNRADLLERCIAGAMAQSLNSSQFEIIVIDNNSTDTTRGVVEAHIAKCRNLKYVFEGVQGLSRARNTGTREARSPIIAYLDDDAIPYPDWAEQLLAVFKQFPDAAIVGGEVEPLWEAERPAWLDDDLLRAYSCGLNWSESPRYLEDGEWLLEGNSAYIRDYLLRAGGFPEELGRKGNILLSGDGAVNSIVSAAGGKQVYAPRARIQHLVPAERLNLQWLAHRRFWGGVTSAVMQEFLKKSIGEIRPWIDLHLPTRMIDWEGMLNLEPDDELKKNLGRIYHLGYFLARSGIIDTK